jgi:ribosomal protein S18 acetylase RimI-like enzyme
MITHTFNPTEVSNLVMEDLLSLFRDASTEEDFMAVGEINDMDTLQKVLLNKNLIHFFGYEDTLPVAYCQAIYKAESKNFNSGAKINALAILPEMRGKGLGKALLTEVVTTLQKNTQIKNIYLEVVKDNVIAVNLYKEIGFEKIGELKSIFTKDGTLLDIEIYSLLVNQ